MDAHSANAVTGWTYKLASALFAFFLWGGWALYINYDVGFSMALRSAITQGIASFTITLIMVYAVTWLYQLLQDSTFSSMSKLRFIVPAIITSGITTTFLYCAHMLVGTPHIMFTIAPAVSIGFVFCLFTNIKLNRTHAH